MDRPEPASSDAMTVVVVGDFNPLVVRPRWLRQMNLIGAEDFDAYEAEIISPGATIIRFGSIELRVLPDILQVTTDSADDVEPARDLVAGILMSNGTPSIAAMGINRIVHFQASLEGYHAIGDTLTPKDLWSGVLKLPGMLSLGITGVRDDGYGGGINVQVQPSSVIQPGVFVSVNDHYTLIRADSPTDRNGAPDPEQINPQRTVEKIPVATELLTKGFSDSRARSLAIIDRIKSLSIPGGSQ